MIRLITAVLVVACLFVSGCGGCQKKTSEKLAEKMIESQMAKNGVKGEVNISDDKVSVKTKDGATTVAYGKSVKVPDSFPKDVPVYDGAMVITAMTVPNGFNLQLQTKDGLEKVAEFYKTRMRSEGWTEEGTFASQEQTTLTYKKERRTAGIVVMASGKETQISVMTTEEKK